MQWPYVSPSATMSIRWKCPSIMTFLSFELLELNVASPEIMCWVIWYAVDNNCHSDGAVFWWHSQSDFCASLYDGWLMLDYNFNLDQADRQFDDVPGIQENLIDAYDASEGYIHLYQNVYFLGPWLFFVILCYLCDDMYIECVNLLFYLAWATYPIVLKTSILPAVPL